MASLRSPWWIAAIATDIAAVRASCQTIRDGWRAAGQDRRN